MKRVFVIAIVLIYYGCKPSTEITGSWKNTNATAVAGDVNTILVTALTDRVNARQIVENELAAALEQKNYRTIKSFDVLPPSFTDGKNLDKNELLSKIEGTASQAILTVALIDKDTETRYVQRNYGYAPIPRFGYYGTFWGYYNTWYPTLYSPGYYEEDKIYFIEINLYDAKTEQLLWSAQSETYNPSTLEGFAENFAKVVVAKMEADGVLKNGNNTGLARERSLKEK
jgi:hypothetical protein